jgi:hypothetical protein
MFTYTTKYNLNTNKLGINLYLIIIWDVTGSDFDKPVQVKHLVRLYWIRIMTVQSKKKYCQIRAWYKCLSNFYNVQSKSNTLKISLHIYINNIYVGINLYLIIIWDVTGSDFDKPVQVKHLVRIQQILS